ncbi:MAG: sulfite exporter TauE/SafE family protein [Burkholderiaceae bacterium]|nr:MAG: sulfite exporter TauE/SafE family protein [Burkholderiaceae bacterium]
MDIHYIISGFSVGLLVGLTGVGGGSLMTPLLTAFFGVAPSVAVGTDLAFASITKASGTLVHRMRRTVHWDVVILLCAGSLPAALVAIWGLHQFGAVNPNFAFFLRWSIAISVMLTVLALLFKHKLVGWLNRHPEKWLVGTQLKAATIGAGVLLGTLVTISSIGAGAVGATIITFLYPRMKTSEVAGTDIAYAVPLTALAATGHAWLGTIHWDLLGALLIGSIPGITIGSFASRAVPDVILRGVLATTLTLVAGKLIL